MNETQSRNMVIIFGGLTFVVIVILALAAYKSVEIMDSPEFCGTTCHTVMSPEYVSYLRSPHARVNCVECHIGSGAKSFIKAKLKGSWQLVAVALDLYEKPIPTPVQGLRPARETCEHCHWHEKLWGDRLNIKTRYQEDEANTETKTVLLMRMGGVSGRTFHGMGKHMGPNTQVRYFADEKRETIYQIQVTKKSNGSVKNFFLGGEKPLGKTGHWRTMDCIDCHNRPTHIFRTAEEAVNMAIQDGKIDRSLPYVRREGLKLLKQEYSSHEEARKHIASRLLAFYVENYPDVAREKEALIQTAAEALGNAFAGNVFPKMHITWGTYPNHRGHQNFPGCFRCHDGNHTTLGGQSITSDCSVCHTLLAFEEEDPEILKQLRP